MMMDWNAYKQRLMQGFGKFAELSPGTIKGIQALEGAGPETGHLDAKTRELIALAVAITTRCDGCISIHTDAAVEAGASREEIAEALGVAIALNAGAALVYSSRVLDAHAQKAG